MQYHRSARKLLALFLIAFLATANTPGGVYARDDDDPRDPGGYDDPPIETPYDPPTNGFSWRTETRFGTYKDGMVNFHYNPVTGVYDPNYIFPSGYKVFFDACTSSDEESPETAANNYTWLIKGTGQPTDGTTIDATYCRTSFSFPEEAQYNVNLTVSPKTGTAKPVTYNQNVTITDYLMVAIGDSYGSGEGNPDVPQKVDWLGYAIAGPKWQDERCHRSAYAGSSQAAMAVERANPHTSVTYISFACSGATIDTPSWGTYGLWSIPGDQGRLDPGKQQGTGVLGRYRGVEPPKDLPYPGRYTNPNDFAQYIPSQIDQLRNALKNPNGGPSREVDALMVSGGGNDIRFGDIAQTCVMSSFCQGAFVEEHPGGNSYRLDTTFGHVLADLPGKYADLAEEIQSLGIKAGNVYLTEYPDPTRADNRNFCEKILDDILVGKHINGGEVVWAHDTVLMSLNQKVAAAAQTHGWNFVGGIAEKFRSEGGKGHGYCASDNWIRTAAESHQMQGPTDTLIPRADTKGLLHPTTRGHQAYSEQILSALKLSDPNNTPPAFTVTSTATPGAGGWYLASPTVVQIKAKDSGKIAQAGISINGTGGCAVPGVTCTTQVSEQEITWTVTATAEGIYRLDFTAEDAQRSGANFTTELKLDLVDPQTKPVELSGTAGENDWYTSAVDVTFDGSDSGTGSGVERILYSISTAEQSLSASSQQLETTPGTPITIADDGVHTVTFQVVDFAGRKSPAESLTLSIDKTAPTVDCATADGEWHASDVTLPCTSSDSTSGLEVADDASFGLTTSVATGDETADAATNSRKVCDVAGNCVTAGPISGNRIDKKAPSITLTSPTSKTYIINEIVAANYACADGGSGVASCVGTVPSGSNIDTQTTGVKNFVVNAADQVGNVATPGSVSYKVTYNICVLYDQAKAHKAGSVAPIKLQLCDSQNKNVSASNIVVNAAGLVKKDSTASTSVVDAGNANPDNNFRYDSTLSGYIYNLSTKGLTTGTWELTFNVAGDPVPHTVRFDVK